jgi:hypothetical protein
MIVPPTEFLTAPQQFLLERDSIPGRRGILPPMKTRTLVPDDLWDAIRPLLPKEPPKPKGGRPRVPVPAVLAASPRALHDGGLTPASGWDDTVGWSSSVLPGCSAAAALVSATNGGRTCSKVCSAWPVI